MEYSLSDFPRPKLRSYSSNLPGKLIYIAQNKLGKDTRYMRLPEPVSNRSECAVPDIKCLVAYCVVQLREPPIRDGQSGQKNEIDQGVDMALLGEITG